MCPVEEEVSQGPALCALSRHGTKRRLLPKLLAVGHGWQKEVLRYSSVFWQQGYPAAAPLTEFTVHSGYKHFPLMQFACSTGSQAQGRFAKWGHICFSVN